MKLLKEDIDLETNDTDELYAFYFPHTSKQILTKDEMIKKLEACLNVVKNGGWVNTGFGMAFRNVQTIGSSGSPYKPTESEKEFFDSMQK